MLLLALSDIHGNYNVYRRIPGLSRELCAECIVLAGDLLGFPDDFELIEEAQKSEADRVLSLLEPLDRPLFYIMGNDDWVELESQGEQIQSIHGRRVDLGKLNFVGYQHSILFTGGVNEKTEEEIAVELRDLEPLLDESTVFVTHSPAFGILDLGFLGHHIGSHSILEIIERKQVRIHIHGHSHCSFGRAGRHFNVASGGDLRAMLIETDTLECEVIWEDTP
jgi:Icc-related predicted phosphoesterase